MVRKTLSVMSKLADIMCLWEARTLMALLSNMCVSTVTLEKNVKT